MGGSIITKRTVAWIITLSIYHTTCWTLCSCHRQQIGLVTVLTFLKRFVNDSLNCFSVTGQLYDLVSDGKIEKETIIEYSTDEGESFIALVFLDDEKEVTVSQETWFAFLDTSFNGEIRDNFTFLEEHFAWPEDFKQCSGRVSNCNSIVEFY